MNALIIFVSFLMYVAGGVTVFIFLALFLAVLAVVSVKAFRLLIALFNASIAEPEASIVRKAQSLNIAAAKRSAKSKQKKPNRKK